MIIFATVLVLISISDLIACFYFQRKWIRKAFSSALLFVSYMFFRDIKLYKIDPLFGKTYLNVTVFLLFVFSVIIIIENIKAPGRKSLMGSFIERAEGRHLLDTKILIHDSLGGILIYARRYLNEKREDVIGEINKEELINRWEAAITMLESEDEEERQLNYKYAFKTAKMLGLKLSVSGALPKNERFIPVVSQGITAALTNAAYHSKADEVFVNVQDDPSLLIEIFDNGNEDDVLIKESGGLLNLRKKVELTGGRMEITKDNKIRISL